MRLANSLESDHRPLVDRATLEWLLAGDAAIRWQVLRDLEGADEQTVARERQRVAESGWGSQLLALQEASGMWGGGLYTPKWISTTYTMLLLRHLGLPVDHPQALNGCQLLLDRGVYKDGGINFFASLKHSETCVTGMVLALAAYFRLEDGRLEQLVTHLLSQQMADGGWNCESYAGATHSSFHTTISVLEGLQEYRGIRGKGIGAWEKGRGEKGKEGLKKLPGDEEVWEAQCKGHEFLLQHRLFRSHRSGEVVDGRMTRFAFPPRWRYDILRGLDYFREAYQGNRVEGVRLRKDERFKDAFDFVRRRRRIDGRWALQSGMPGRIFFEVEKVGEPSRWITLRAMRVLKWWEEAV